MAMAKLLHPLRVILCQDEKPDCLWVCAPGHAQECVCPKSESSDGFDLARDMVNIPVAEVKEYSDRMVKILNIERTQNSTCQRTRELRINMVLDHQQINQ